MRMYSVSEVSAFTLVAASLTVFCGLSGFGLRADFSPRFRCHCSEKRHCARGTFDGDSNGVLFRPVAAVAAPSRRPVAGVDAVARMPDADTQPPVVAAAQLGLNIAQAVVPRVTAAELELSMSPAGKSIRRGDQHFRAQC